RRHRPAEHTGDPRGVNDTDPADDAVQEMSGTESSQWRDALGSRAEEIEQHAVLRRRGHLIEMKHSAVPEPGPEVRVRVLTVPALERLVGRYGVASRYR